MELMQAICSRAEFLVEQVTGADEPDWERMIKAADELAGYALIGRSNGRDVGDLAPVDPRDIDWT